jgi:Protein of unknown function (DUF1826)
MINDQVRPIWRWSCYFRLSQRLAWLSIILLLPTIQALNQQLLASPSGTSMSPAAARESHMSPPFLHGRGDWGASKSSLRRSDCCVTFVHGLESHVQILQQVLADQGPSEIDLRARIRVSSSSSSSSSLTYEDCLKVRNSVIPLTKEEMLESSGDNRQDPCSLALAELASGMASLADGTLSGVVEDVFCRIVCASDYRAIDPPFHTDKAPLRGYVTLRGVGTQFMNRPCHPTEYLTLRTLGEGEPTRSLPLQTAEELEFIVMKGDYYNDHVKPDGSSEASSLFSRFWKRATACVHRSPPGKGGRRVIVSFDLADGDDDREWYQVGLKRQWRSGMTQRKSRLVA